MYRMMKVYCVVADDSNLNNKSFERSATIWKTVDLKADAPTLRVAPADTNTQVALPVTNIKAWAVFADYPVQVRFNASNGTPHPMSVSNVPAVNVGSPLPPQGCIAGNTTITGIWLSPITSASQTANVWIMVVGDPIADYSA